MSVTRKQENALTRKVRSTLTAAGFEEAMTRRTLTTNRERYIPEVSGFRLHIGIDPLFAQREAVCTDPPRFLFVQTASRSKKLLAEYAAALNAAGIDAVIDRSQYCKRLRVWIRRPIGDRAHDDHPHDGGTARVGQSEASGEDVARTDPGPEDGG